jgi:hypothetical protein
MEKKNLCSKERNSIIKLILFAPSNIIIFEVKRMGYITANQAADKWNISQRRVQVLCAQERIDGVFKLGDNWAIPDNAEKPTDFRRKKINDEEQ